MRFIFMWLYQKSEEFVKHYSSKVLIIHIRYATLCIRENPGCLFIATNRDAVGHMTDLQEWPGKFIYIRHNSDQMVIMGR